MPFDLEGLRVETGYIKSGDERVKPDKQMRIWQENPDFRGRCHLTSRV